MKRVTRTITLASSDRYGSLPPSEAIAPALKWVPRVAGDSIAMAMRGRSRVRGVRPDWLRQATDVRFRGIEGDDDSTLVFEVPTLGTAAPDLYRHLQTWADRPAPDSTGFDLLAEVVRDVAAHNADSDRFDDGLLGQFPQFKKVLGKHFREIRIGADEPALFTNRATINAGVIATAEQFLTSTPNSRPVRVVGTLDMVRASTNSFGLRLDDGQNVRGVLVEGTIVEPAQWLDQRVLVLGQAVYRASGTLLRLDASEVLSGEGQPTFWSRIPASQPQRFDLRRAIREQAHKPGAAAIFGQWPGDETDDQIEQALRNIG